MMLPATQTLVSSWLRHTLNDLIRIRRAVAEGRAAHLVNGTERRDRPRAIVMPIGFAKDLFVKVDYLGLLHLKAIQL